MLSQETSRKARADAVFPQRLTATPGTVTHPKNTSSPYSTTTRPLYLPSEPSMITVLDVSAEAHTFSI